MPFERPVPMTPWGKLAFTVVVLQGALQASFDPRSQLTHAAKLALWLVAAVYIALGSSDRARTVMGTGRYLFVQHALGLALPWLGQGFTAMGGLPVISQSGLVLAGARVVVPAVLHTANVFVACTRFVPGELGLQLVYTFVVAVVFTMAFTQAVASELRTREQLDVASRALAAHADEHATMRERTRIARELHDSIGHTLTTTHVHLLLAERDLATAPERAGAALQVAKRVVHAGLVDLRQTVRALHVLPPDAQSLERALEQLVADHQDGALSIALRVSGEPRALPRLVSVSLFRIAQEGLTNVVKHAKAKSALVELTYQAHAVRLGVADDGIGMGESSSEGFGLRGMRERASALEGSLDLVRQGGLKLTVQIPC